MKKVISLAVAAIMLVAFSVCSYATNGFVQSPSSLKTSTKITIAVDNTGKNVIGSLVITPYKNRNKLAAEKKTALEAAYNEIKGSSSLTALCSGLTDVIKGTEIEASALAVSDLFDISWNGGNKPDSVTVTLGTAMAGGFVAVIHRGGNGWEVISGAELSDDKKSVTFTASDFSPFALVVDRNDPDAPQTTDLSWLYISVAALAVVGLCAITINEKRKKNA